MMNFKMYFDRIVFLLRNKITANVLSKFRILYFNSIGANISFKSHLGNNIQLVWPHQLKISKKNKIEDGVIFKYDGMWKSGPSIIIEEGCFIGHAVEFNIKGAILLKQNCLIGAGSRFIDHDHGIEMGVLIKNQSCPTKNIEIGQDVWIGANVVVLKGCTIGDGAIVAAGAIVVGSIPPNEIWGGVPAKKIKNRHN